MIEEIDFGVLLRAVANWLHTTLCALVIFTVCTPLLVGSSKGGASKGDAIGVGAGGSRS